MTKITLQLAIFAVAAVPGYILAIARPDRIGHRRLQLLGFAMMALCFAIIAVVPGMTTMVVPFLPVVRQCPVRVVPDRGGVADGGAAAVIMASVMRVARTAVTARPTPGKI